MKCCLMKRQNNAYEEWKVRENLVDFVIRNYHIIFIMNSDKQRAAIAEACGWGGFEGNGEFLIGVPPQNEITEKLLGPKIITNWTPRFDVPDYLNDLNAMHEAEKVLHSQSVISAYVHQLHSIVKANMWAHEDAICATAAQRAEAFLKTIGKWEE